MVSLLLAVLSLFPEVSSLLTGAGPLTQPLKTSKVLNQNNKLLIDMTAPP